MSSRGLAVWALAFLGCGGPGVQDDDDESVGNDDGVSCIDPELALWPACGRDESNPRHIAEPGCFVPCDCLLDEPCPGVCNTDEVCTILVVNECSGLACASCRAGSPKVCFALPGS